MKIILIGFMGAGKSSKGKKLANAMNLKFIDLDKYIENKEEKSISGIFEQHGEEYFRKKESEYLKEVLCEDNIVLATGGGTPCFYDNIDIINRAGISIYIKMDSKTLVNRIYHSKKTNRPLITGKNKVELLDYIDMKLEERNSFYNKCKIHVNGLYFNIRGLSQKLKKYN